VSERSKPERKGAGAPQAGIVIYQDVSQGAIVYRTEAGEQRRAVPSGFSPGSIGSFSSDNRSIGPSRFYTVKVSPSGRYVALMLFSKDEAELKVYELKSGRLVVDSPVKTIWLTFNTNETRLAISTTENAISQEQVAQGKLLVYDLTAPQTVREPLLTLRKAAYRAILS